MTGNNRLRARVGRLLLRFWRRFPWPAGRGRYFFKRTILEPLLPREEPILYDTVAGKLFLVVGEDLLQTSIAYSGTHYEQGVLELLKDRSLVAEGQVVLDVGAHAGFYTLLLGKAVGPKGLVVAFEPQPKLASQVRQSLRKNRISWGQVEECAISDQAGAGHLFRTRDLGRSSMTAQQLEPEAAIEVSMCSVDEYVYRALGRPPALIKMDIEGGEWLALRGMRRVLAEARPKLIVEVHPALIEALGGTAQQLVARLAENNYDLFLIDRREGRVALKEVPTSASPWHLLALPRSGSS